MYPSPSNFSLVKTLEQIEGGKKQMQHVHPLPSRRKSLHHPERVEPSGLKFWSAELKERVRCVAVPEHITRSREGSFPHPARAQTVDAVLSQGHRGKGTSGRGNGRKRSRPSFPTFCVILFQGAKEPLPGLVKQIPLFPLASHVVCVPVSTVRLGIVLGSPFSDM
jgi:hypothetical protein